MKRDEAVYVVDDDFRVRESLEALLASAGFEVVLFSKASEYLGHRRRNVPACLILDVELPDISGLELQSMLAPATHPPIVFITGHGDIPSTVRACKAGAVDVLPKPFGGEQLLRAIDMALYQDRVARDRRAEMETLERRHATLTPREREVLPLVVSGLLNKQAASELGISEVTFQIHRGKVMQKMAAQSLAELVRMADALRIPVTHSRRTRR